MDLAFRATFETLALPPPTHNSAVEVMRVVYVPGEDYWASRSTKGVYETLNRRSIATRRT